MKDNIMEYKGYHGSVEYSATDRCFFGKILGIRSVILYEGNDVKTIEKDFHASVDEYLEYCKKKGVSPEKNYSGSFQVRVSPETHRELSDIATISGKKLNTVVAEALAEYVAGK